MTYLGIVGAILGLGVSLYIFKKKQTKTRLICPRESNCEKVVHSTHATTFGIGNEVLGIGYYVLQLVLWGIVVGGYSSSPWVLWVLTILTIGGALFSLYLIALQWLVIRAWCMWCLGSALANILFVIALWGIPMTGLFALIASQRLWWVIVHNIGFILGLGGATITDIFFFRFLRDGIITEQEKSTMDTLSSVIWVGLAILIASGIMLYLPEQARFDVSAKFLLKLVVVSVIVVNGLFLNLLVAPRMRSLSFAREVPARRFRRLAFALGAISITSWYTAFILGSFRRISLPLREGVALYVIALAAVVTLSQIYERVVVRHRHTPSQQGGNLV